MSTRNCNLTAPCQFEHECILAVFKTIVGCDTKNIMYPKVSTAGHFLLLDENLIAMGKPTSRGIVGTPITNLTSLFARSINFIGNDRECFGCFFVVDNFVEFFATQRESGLVSH